MPRVTRLGAAGAALVLLLTGCGGGSDDPGAGEEGTASESTSESSSASPSSSAPASEEPSEPATSAATSEPAVTPATGERVQAGTFSFVVPDGFTASGSSSGGLAGAATYTDLTTTFCIIDASQVADTTGSLDQEGAAALQTGSNPDLTRLPDREVGGEQVFAFTAETDSGTEYLFGRLAGDQVAELSFTFAPEAVRGAPVDPTADQALVESVLATVEWSA